MIRAVAAFAVALAISAPLDARAFVTPNFHPRGGFLGVWKLLSFQNGTPNPPVDIHLDITFTPTTVWTADPAHPTPYRVIDAQPGEVRLVLDRPDGTTIDFVLRWRDDRLYLESSVVADPYLLVPKDAP